MTYSSLKFLAVITAACMSTMSTNAFAPQSSAFHRTAFSSRTPSTTTGTSTTSLRSVTLADVSDFYQDFPLQAAVLTCGVKASAADCIAQLKATNTLEFRRNVAYVLYGGIFVGLMCHMEYDYLFPFMFGTEHTLKIIAEKVVFDDFISAPFFWLPPAYLIKALVYDYPMKEGLEKYVHDIRSNGLLWKYWTIWVPAQSISFSVVPDHLRVAFMATISFFWFILFSSLAAKSDNVDVSATAPQDETS